MMIAGFIGRGGSGKSFLTFAVSTIYVIQSRGQAPVVMVDGDLTNNKLTTLARVTPRATINDYLVGSAEPTDLVHTSQLIRSLAIDGNIDILANAPIYVIPARAAVESGDISSLREVTAERALERLIELEEYLVGKYACPILLDMKAGSYAPLEEVTNAMISWLDVVTPVLIPDETEILNISRAASRMADEGIVIATPVINKYRIENPFNSEGVRWEDFVYDKFSHLVPEPPFVVPFDPNLDQFFALNKVILSRFGKLPAIVALRKGYSIGHEGSFVSFFFDFLSRVPPRKKRAVKYETKKERDDWFSLLGLEEEGLPELEVPEGKPAEVQPPRREVEVEVREPKRRSEYLPPPPPPVEEQEEITFGMSESEDVGVVKLIYPDGFTTTVQADSFKAIVSAYNISPTLKRMLMKGVVDLSKVEKVDIPVLKEALRAHNLPIPKKGKGRKAGKKEGGGFLSSLLSAITGSGSQKVRVYLPGAKKPITIDREELEEIATQEGLAVPEGKKLDLRDTSDPLNLKLATAIMKRKGVGVGEPAAIGTGDADWF